MRSLFLSLFLLFPFIIISQNNDTKKENFIQLRGSVKDSFTKMGLGDARISFYDEDGSWLGNGFVMTFADRPKKDNMFWKDVPRKRAKYRFHAECEGYEPADMWYELKNPGRNKVITLPDLLMKRDFKSLNKEIECDLDEVVVKATKIKMQYKGDTIIYNADAFNLPDGSMLDDLIRQMPGAELKDNGEIFINGRKLDFLTLNGKDFFGNNSKIMLDNLPYYIIDKLKVFEQSTVRSKALGHDVDAKLYVMDVRLKKEYSVGYLGNVTVAGGTKERYLGKLFGLRFTDNTRISLFGNTNNVNEKRKPGADSEWTPSDMTVGIENRHNGGVDIMHDDNDGRFTENGNITFSWTKTTGETHVASESFLNSGNAFGRNISNNNTKNFNINLDNTFTLKKPWFIDFRTTASYNKQNSGYNSTGASFNSDPDSYGTTVSILDSLLISNLSGDLRDITLNYTTNRNKGESKTLSLGQTARLLKSLKWGDDLEINAGINFNTAKAHDFSLYYLDFLHSESEDGEYRNRYNDSPGHDYNYNAKVLYRFNFMNQMNLELSYCYNQIYRYADRSKYRLDQIDGWDYDDHTFGVLPSSCEIIRMGLDKQNSHTTGYMNKNNDFTVFFTKWFFEVHKFVIGGITKNINERNDYMSEVIDTLMNRNQWIFTPDVTYGYYPKKNANWWNSYTIRYQMIVDMPDMNLLVPVYNDYNPLAIRVGNSDLRNTINNFVLLSLNNQGRGWGMFHGARLNIRKDMIATGFTFDKETGVYTYKPENVSGNWYVNIFQNINKNLDKAKLFNISHHLGYDFYKNVDLTTVVDNQDAVTGFSARSTVKTNIVNETLHLTYSKGFLKLGTSGMLTFRNSTSERDDFMDINVWDFSYGVNGHYTFPWKLHFATDLKMYSRRGYSDSSMNTNDLIWNASVSRPFFKGKFVTIIQGFDMLHNLRNVTYNINGKGLTEVWNRSIPSYLMLHLQYKFHKNPKKKN